MPHDNPPEKSPEPTIHELRMLLAFQEAGGVSAAAKTLGMTQPTMSRHLAVFQKPGSDGQPVLKKQSNRLVFTSKGERMVSAVRDVVRQYVQLLKYLDGAAGEPQSLRLGVGNFAMRHYVPLVLAEIALAAGRFYVAPHILRGRDRILGVAGGELDLAVVTHDSVQIHTMLSVFRGPSAELAIEPLARQTFCVVACEGTAAADQLNSIAANRSVPGELLSEWQLVGLDEQSGIRRLIERELRKSNKTLRFVPGTGTGGWPAALEFARQGLGVAVVPLAEVATATVSGLMIRPLADRFVIEDNLIHRDHPLGEAQQQLKNALLRAAKRHHKSLRQNRKTILETE